jgi:hypothetical protein
MTVKQAINVLKKQRDKLDDPSYTNDENWLFQTASFIKDFFGDHSTEYAFIAQFKFYVTQNAWDSDEDIRRLLSEQPLQAKQFLDNCIETLQHKNLYKPSKSNFISRITETAFWTNGRTLLPVHTLSELFIMIKKPEKRSPTP